MRQSVRVMGCVVNLMLSTCLHAAIVLYDFSGNGGAEVRSGPAAFDPLVVPLDITRGSGLTSPSGSNSFNSAHWHDRSAEDYISFGFAVLPGYEARLTSLNFTSRSSSSGPGTLAVRFSRDGYTHDLASWTQSGSRDANVAIDLSPLGSITRTAEFRIFSVSDLSAAGGTVASAGTWRIGTMTTPGASNLLSIDGQIASIAAVPEPASWLLLTLFGLLTAARRLFERLTLSLRPLVWTLERKSRPYGEHSVSFRVSVPP